MTARIEDENGFIEIKDNPLSRAGIFDYLGSEIGTEDANKLYRVLRSGEMLKEATDLFKGKPIIVDHIMLGKDGIDAGKKGIDGVVGDEVYFKDDVIYGNIRLFTDKIKEAIDAGKKELSFGYWTEYNIERGTYKGEPYDATQKIIGGNHLALVEEGRMGSSVAVLDGAINKANEGIDMNNENEEKATDEDIEEAKDEDVEAKDEDIEEAKDEDVEAKDEDIEEAKDEDKNKKDSMDALVRRIDNLEKRLKASTDSRPTPSFDSVVEAVRKGIIEADKMYNIVQPLVGTFDHSNKDAVQIATYAANKLKLKGDAVTAVTVYSQAMESTKKATTDSHEELKYVLNIGEFS